MLPNTSLANFTFNVTAHPNKFLYNKTN